MQDEEGHLSPSGVWISDDFRTNLIIDRYDPVFADMRASKIKHLRSANSEDAVTWNAFRSLRQIAPEAWLRSLWEKAFRVVSVPCDLRATIKLWESFSPPPGLLAGGDEGASEIDVVIEAPSWVWFIEAKYRSDISKGTTTRPVRDQILRNIDVGSYYAGVRRFFFSLLINSAQRSPMGVDKVTEYADLAVVRARLATHREDGLPNLAAVGYLTWLQISEVLTDAEEAARHEDEKIIAARASAWLKQRVLPSVSTQLWNGPTPT